MDEYGNMTLHEKYCSKQDFVDTTIQYYESHAEEFASNTKDVDMGSIRSRLLSYIPKGGRILDFGCGTGRDAKAFLDLGYDVTAIDGSEAMCQIAHTLTGLPIRCLDFRKYVPALDEAYDGIWACASLLHLRRDELIPVMCSLCQALQPEGGLRLPLARCGRPQDPPRPRAQSVRLAHDAGGGGGIFLLRSG